MQLALALERLQIVSKACAAGQNQWRSLYHIWPGRSVTEAGALLPETSITTCALLPCTAQPRYHITFGI